MKQTYLTISLFSYSQNLDTMHAVVQRARLMIYHEMNTPYQDSLYCAVVDAWTHHHEMRLSAVKALSSPSGGVPNIDRFVDITVPHSFLWLCSFYNAVELMEGVDGFREYALETIREKVL